MTALPWLDVALAEKVAHRLLPPGPPATRAQRRECVEELRTAALSAPALVAEVTGLPLVSDGLVRVVDRRGWASAMTGTVRALWQRLGAPPEPTLGQRVQGRAVASQLGAGLALVGTRILGQFDPFVAPPRLLLVAPNVMHVERTLRLDPGDFRRWVCLHEQTHRVQFAAAPWLPEHLLTMVGEVLWAEDEAGEGVADVLSRALADRRRGTGRPEHSNGALLDVVSAPTARAGLDRVTAVMSLLEGHADVVMDLAGPEVVRTLPTIRSRFEARRDQGGRWAFVSRLLGMDAKLAQYRDGAVFCRAVLDVAGHGGLNRVFDSPATLPTRDELAHPEQWLQRVLGLGARPA